MSNSESAKRPLASILGMALVLALSLALLVYVGMGEAFRTYPRFEMDKFAAQAETVKNATEIFLSAGLPIEQFPGFTSLTQPLLEADPAIVTIAVIDMQGQPVFQNSSPAAPSGDAVMTGYTQSKLQDDKAAYKLLENDTYYQVSLPLANKFEQVGNLIVIVPRALIADKISAGFNPVGIALIVILLVALVAFMFAARLKEELSARYETIIYGIGFLAMAVVVIATLINVYGAGIQSKTQALTKSLAERLRAPLSLGIDLADLDGIGDTFAEYRTANPDISYISLSKQNVISIHTDAALVGTTAQSHANQYEYEELINQSDQLDLRMGIPQDVVFAQLWRSVKNFSALFVAAGFLSAMFFTLLNNFNNRPSASKAGKRTAAEELFGLGLIRPLYFLGVFVDGLTKSFLPQYYKKVVSGAGWDPGIVSTLFTLYFLSYALALFPAGRMTERGVKPLLVASAAMMAAALALIAFVPNPYVIFLVQILAGLGQGAFFIGVQSYILQMASPAQRTRGAAIIVFGYNGGIISGVAIGALLAVYMGQQGVFITGMAIALLVLLYAAVIPETRGAVVSALRPKTTDAATQTEQAALEQVGPAPAVVAMKVKGKGGKQKVEAQSAGQPAEGTMGHLARALRDFEFMKATVLIGIPTKIIMAGFISAALPLLLSQQNYATEDIGQIIMFYSLGVLIASGYISGRVDRIGKTSRILLIGALGSGLGLGLIGIMNWSALFPQLTTAAPFLVLLGMLLLGFGHGFIQAPIITHVANTPTGSNLGHSSATSLYRLFERIGNVAGPILISYLLLNSSDVFMITWIGLGIVVFGLIFGIRFGSSTTTSSPAA